MSAATLGGVAPVSTRVMNLSHLLTGTARRHGEAIGYGMLAACDIAEHRRTLDPKVRKALAVLIARLGPMPSVADLSAKQIIEAMKRDKKVVAGKLHFVLPSSIGRVTTVDDVSTRQINGALRRLDLQR